MKILPLHEKHKELGAKFIEFGEWLMPVEYTKLTEEHDYVRNNVGVFDVSHMGQIDICGRDALKLVQWITTNDASKLKMHDAQYSMMCYGGGTIMDDIYVYKLKDSYRLVVNASNIEKNYRYIKEKASIFDVEVENASDKTVMLAVQGPKSFDIIHALYDFGKEGIGFPYKKNKIGEVRLNYIDVLIARTGYTGEDGFELMVDKKHAEELWKLVFEVGRKFDLKPVGLGARDTLRLEMGYPLYGNDIDDERTPLEAGLKHFVDLERNFCGKWGMLERKVKEKLICFEMLEKPIPRQHYGIYLNWKIGEVTSGTFSPTLKKGIGMGYVKKDFAMENSRIFIDIRGKKVPAKIVRKPFIRES